MTDRQPSAEALEAEARQLLAETNGGSKVLQAVGTGSVLVNRDVAIKAMIALSARHVAEARRAALEEATARLIQAAADWDGSDVKNWYTHAAQIVSGLIDAPPASAK
jgi:hypothetical protein